MNRINHRRVGASQGGQLETESQTLARDDGQGQQRRRGALPVSFMQLISYALIVAAIVIGALLGVLVATLLWGPAE